MSAKEIPVMQFNSKEKWGKILGFKITDKMSLEEYVNYIANLKQENEKLKEKELDYTTIYLKGFEDGKDKLQQENKELKDNWNKLKQYLEQKINDSVLEDDVENAFYMAIILQEMQEIDGGK